MSNAGNAEPTLSEAVSEVVVVSRLELPESLLERLQHYASRRGLALGAAAQHIVDAGLRAHERAVVAGKARAAQRTPEELAAMRAKRKGSREGGAK